MSVTTRQRPARSTVAHPRTWTLAAVLLTLAGVLGALATMGHRADCPVRVTPTCAGGQAPYGTLPLLSSADPTRVVLLGGLCALGLASAWFTALVAARLRPTVVGCGALVGLQPVAAAVAVLAQPLRPGVADAVLGSLWFYLAPDLAAVVFVGLILRRDVVPSGVDRARWLVLTGAATVFGAVPALLVNLVLAFWRPEMAEAEPDSGYGLAGLLVAGGVGLLAITAAGALRHRSAAAASRPSRQNLVTSARGRSSLQAYRVDGI
ncbi:MAG: hypothetical protein ACR2LI_16005 [Propionibacteriaceae bacterium]